MLKSNFKTKKQPSPFFPKGRQLDTRSLKEIKALLHELPHDREYLIENLHIIQDQFKQISSNHLAALAEIMKLSMAEVFEVATFYHHFDIVKEGEKPIPKITIRICEGVSCEMAKSKVLFGKLSEVIRKDVRLIYAPCVGACDKAPVAVVNKRQIHHANLKKLQNSLSSKDTKPLIPAYKSFDEYHAEGGYKEWAKCLNNYSKREEVISHIDSSGLRGLGGAGFPTGRKWGFLKDAKKPRILAINADEGEPGTFKDRFILDTNPHRMLEGILITAWAVEANKAYIYLRDEYHQSREVLLLEITKLKNKNLLGDIEIHLRRGAGAYICGEESAMLESIEGKRGLPRNRPPFPAQSGLFGYPTLINNVETMYWIPEILKNTASWYKNEGRPHFYSVSGRVKEPGIKLAPAGVTVNQLINDFSGGMIDGHRLMAFLPGGASGGLLPAEKENLPLDFGSLDEFGCFIGSSAVVVFSEHDKIGDICKNLVHFFEDESCGQCTPCRVGCEKLSKLISREIWDTNLIKELSTAMQDASICGLGQAAPNPVLSAIRFFPEHIK